MMGHKGGGEDKPVVSFHSQGPQGNLQETLTTHRPGWSRGHTWQGHCGAAQHKLGSWRAGPGKWGQEKPSRRARNVLESNAEQLDLGSVSRDEWGQNERQAARMQNSQLENIKAETLEEPMGLGQMPPTYPWPCGLGGWLDSKAQGGGRHLEPTHAVTPIPRSRPLVSLVTEGPLMIRAQQANEGMETEGRLSLRVTRRGSCQRSSSCLNFRELTSLSSLVSQWH